MINRARKSRIKTLIKHFEAALAGGDAKAASEQYKLVVKRLDKTAAISTMHKKTAARRKSRLARRLNTLMAKTG
jgi:small subunit ribosomal protein S20